MKKIKSLFTILIAICLAVLLQTCQNDFTSHTVTYDGNGNDSGEAPKDDGSYMTGQLVTILSPVNLRKTSYSFVNWNSQMDGKGTSYTVNNKFPMPGENITLYAIWTQKSICTVTYYGNGNTSGSVPSNPINYEQEQTVLVCDNTGKLMKTGYTFTGWNTQTDGSGTCYKVQNKFDINSINVGLYAQWAIIIACGEMHTAAIKADGTLWTWGKNSSGQLGNGTNTDSSSPKVVPTGNTWCEVACGYNFTVAVRTDGTLWAWGDNFYHQLGDGTTTNQITPEQIGSDKNWNYVACGYQHTIAIKTDGSLWAWGRNDDGQLGDGTTINRYLPVPILPKTQWAQVACGAYYTAAVKTDGSLWTWGHGGYGQLGYTTPTGISSSPGQIGKEHRWSKVACGFSHTTAITTDGSLWVCGDNSNGSLGDGTTTNSYSLIPIMAEKTLCNIACGAGHTIAVAKGGLYVWGYNCDGQLGDGFTINLTVPKQILTGTTLSQVACGSYYTVGVRTDGALLTWGSNFYGQLGDGTTNGSHIPKSIGFLIQ
jgi:uncharacterized repeat protein (TIGR02543 family)